MRLAAIRNLSVISLLMVTVVLAMINWESVELAALELVFIGRIPGVEMYLSYEAFLSGFIIFTWIIWVYKGYSYCHDQIANLLTIDDERVEAIKEVAL